MSCDNNTRAYCERAGATLAPTLGVSQVEATELLLQVHELGTTRAEQALAARRDGNGQGATSRQAALVARAADTAAEEATVEIFSDMRAMSPQMAVPAHGDANPLYGFALPKRPIQYGWKEVRDLRRIAIEGTQAGLSPDVIRGQLSPLASEVLQAQQTQAGANGEVGQLGMARRGHRQAPPSVLIEVEGQVIPIAGADFGTILTAVKALPGVNGRCFNADRDGRGTRWMVPGTMADVASALHGYGMTVNNAAPAAGTPEVPIPQPPASPTVLGDDALVAITNGRTGPEARDYLDTIWGPSGMGGAVPQAVRSLGLNYQRNRDNPRAQRLLAQALAESQYIATCSACGQFMGQSAHICPAIAGAPGAHTAETLNGWAQAITMVPGVRDVASGLNSVDLSQPESQETAAALLSAATAVVHGALPCGVSASPALQQAARDWLGSQWHNDAQIFAHALVEATIVPASPVSVEAAIETGAEARADAVDEPQADALQGVVAQLQDALGNDHVTPSSERAEDADAHQSGIQCPDCGQFMGHELHMCHPGWLETYPNDLRARAQQFVRGLPGIVEMANGSTSLGFGPHGTSERRALETYASYMQAAGSIEPDALQVAEGYVDQPFRNAQAFAAIVAIASGVLKCPDCGQFLSAVAGHVCPARLSVVPTDVATIDWLRTLAGTDAVQNARNLRGGWDVSAWGRSGGSISRGYSTKQAQLGRSRARYSPCGEPVSPLPPPNRTCAFQRIRLSR